MPSDSQQPQPTQDQFFRPIGEVVEATAGPEPATAKDDAPAQEGSGSNDLIAGSELVQEVESLCMNCQQTGATRLLLTSIPYFRQVIISSFYCPHCHERNNEIQPAGTIQPKGVVYTVHLTRASDLDRQVVKSGTATLAIPELALEIPPQRGQLTTIEGVLSDTLRDLEMDQPLRKHMAPEAYEKIQQLCDRIKVVIGETEEEEEPQQEDQNDVSSGKIAGSGGLVSEGAIGPSSTGAKTGTSADPNRAFPSLTVRLDDPTGNSFIEFLGPVEGLGAKDAKWTKREYGRTKEQNEALGIGPGPTSTAAEVEEDAGPERTIRTTNVKEEGDGDDDDGEGEVFSFPGTCSSCAAPVPTMMHKLTIPYFKDVIIMSTNCERCGYRDNEVKAGGAVSSVARRLTLKVEDAEDLSRDVLKSDSAALEIPEIELRLAPGTLGGRFTTLEGLLQQVYDELSEKVMNAGDSSAARGVDADRLESFLGKLKGVISVDQPFTVVLDDALANSYIQSPYAPDPDPQLTMEEYPRTWEQDEDLGLNDINVEPEQYRPDGEAFDTWQKAHDERQRQHETEAEAAAKKETTADADAGEKEA